MSAVPTGERLSELFRGDDGLTGIFSTILPGRKTPLQFKHHVRDEMGETIPRECGYSLLRLAPFGMVYAHWKQEGRGCSCLPSTTKLIINICPKLFELSIIQR